MSNSTILKSAHSVRRNRLRRHIHSQHEARLHAQLLVEYAEVADKTGSSQQKTIRLPKCLRRGPYVEVSYAALEALEPRMKGFTLEMFLNGLKSLGPNLLIGLAKSKIELSNLTLPLPQEVDVVVQGPSDPPTHLLAVHSKPNGRVFLVPVHSLVLAAHCARLPPLPPSASHKPPQTSRRIAFAITPFCIPNPETFIIIIRYLYTKRLDRLFFTLVPVTVQGKLSIELLQQACSAAYNVQALLSLASTVHGLWNNVVALGISDEMLLRCIEAAWMILLKALEVNAEARWETGAQL